MIKILKLLIRLKFIFNSPSKCSLIVFDESYEDLNNFLPRSNYFLLQNRLENIDKIYISFRILKLIFRNYKDNLMTAYLVSIIDIVSPKIILTFIDNSFKFSDLAKLREKKCKFIAIQNGVRFQINESNYLANKNHVNYNKKIYLPYFFCFGKYEKFLYKKNNIQVKNFIPVGSLRLANFIEYKKNNKKILESFFYDICLMSEVDSWQSELKIPKLEEGFAKLTKYAIRFCREHNIKLVLCLKRNKAFADSFSREQEFFKKYLSIDEYEYLKKRFFFKKKDKFSSYKCMSKSKVVLGTVSTMLRENLAIGGKILSCNLTPTNIYDFPIKGICSIKNCSYNDFEERLILILRMKNKEYHSKVSNGGDYNMFFRKNYSSITKIKDELYKIRSLY